MKMLKFVVLVGILALLPLLTGWGSAQTADPQGITSPSGTVASAISFQGILTDLGGTPLTGTYDVEFKFYTSETGMTTVGVATTWLAQNIIGGRCTTNLPLDPDLIHGQELWLSIRVRPSGGAWQTLTPRIEVLPTMYAMTVRPGAHVKGAPSGPVGATFRATLQGTGTFAKAIWAVTEATGTAVHAESASGYGVYGYSPASYGVWGKSENSWGGYFLSQNGYGLRAESKGDDHWDHGGYFSSNRGWGVLAESAQNTGVRGEGAMWGVQGAGDFGGVSGSSDSGDGVSGWSNTSVGVYGTSFDDNGVEGVTWRSDNNYGLYTYDNLYSNNYHLAGAIMNVAQNGGDSSLEPGDVVVFSGISEPLEATGSPVIQVAKADAANSIAVAGVVHQRLNIEALAEKPNQTVEMTVNGAPRIGGASPSGPGEPSYMEVTSDGPVAPGDYLLLVVQGPAQVKASALGGTIQPGDLLTSSTAAGYAAQAATITIQGVSTTAPGTVFGKALEPLDAGQALIYVFVTLQ